MKSLSLVEYPLSSEPPVVKTLIRIFSIFSSVFWNIPVRALIPRPVSSPYSDRQTMPTLNVIFTFGSKTGHILIIPHPASIRRGYTLVSITPDFDTGCRKSSPRKHPSNLPSPSVRDPLGTGPENQWRPRIRSPH